MEKKIDITDFISHEDPINGIDDVQKILHKEIRGIIFGTVRVSRWHRQRNLDQCIEASLSYIFRNGHLKSLCDLNDILMKQTHDHFDETLGEELVDTLLSFSIKAAVRQVVTQIWSEVGPGSRRKK